MGPVPTGASLTTCCGSVVDFMAMSLQQLIDQVVTEPMPPKVTGAFELADIVEAHRLLQSNGAGGKIEVATR